MSQAIAPASAAHSAAAQNVPARSVRPELTKFRDLIFKADIRLLLPFPKQF
jgi:hypothetical protein